MPRFSLDTKAIPLRPLRMPNLQALGCHFLMPTPLFTLMFTGSQDHSDPSPALLSHHHTSSLPKASAPGTALLPKRGLATALEKRSRVAENYGVVGRRLWTEAQSEEYTCIRVHKVDLLSRARLLQVRAKFSWALFSPVIAISLTHPCIWHSILVRPFYQV